MKQLLNILPIILLFISVVSDASIQENQTTTDLVSKIDRAVADIEAFRAANQDNEKEYVIGDLNDTLALVDVAENTSSEQTEATYFLLYDNQGRLLSHTEVPTSVSGDWHIERTHYFDSSGRTIMFKNYSYHYNSGCAFLLHVTRSYYLDSDFRIIKKLIEYTDKDNKVIANPSKCEEYGTKEQDQEVLQPNYAEIQKRIKRKLVIYKESRIERARIMQERMQLSERQRQQWAKEDEQYERLVRKEHFKHIIRSTLYLISLTSLLIAITLLLKKKLKKNRSH